MTYAADVDEGGLESLAGGPGSSGSEGLLVEVADGSLQLTVEVGDLMAGMRFKDAEEAEQTVLSAVFLQAQRLHLPSRVLARLAAQSNTHFSKRIIR
jgi:hypothetical protein